MSYCDVEGEVRNLASVILWGCIDAVCNSLRQLSMILYRYAALIGLKNDGCAAFL